MTTVYFHRDISNIEAEELLQKTKQDGSFLVKNSETLSGAYVLFLLYQSEVYRYRILSNKDGTLSLQTMKQEKAVHYTDLDALITTYISMEAKNGLICALKYPVSPKKTFEIKEALEKDANGYLLMGPSKPQ